MSSSQSLFQNAKNFEVKDSQFNATIINNTGNNDSVSTILWPHVAAGAIFDSAARYAAGKCHPGTRTKIIAKIVDWINEPNPTKCILWLHGAAGAGKSAIAQTICERLRQDNPDWLGGSFFFEFGPTDRGNALKLFATLSYQLAIQFPHIRAEINDMLSHDPSLPTKSMEIQLNSLIIQPLLRCQSLISHSPTLIIDGLDECADDKGMDVQCKIVALIAKSIVDHKLPLRCIIASRPEYWIRDAFDTERLHKITFPLTLRDDEDADNDIRTYLIEGFDKIRVENKRIMSSVVLPWPPTKVIERFVQEASGQYIYAATILGFVGKYSRFSNPLKQLEIILSPPSTDRALAFSDLDKLYATIVSAYPGLETMKRVLAGILVGANTPILKVVLRVDSDELVLVLDALSSLINIQMFKPPEDEGQPGLPLEVLESIFGNLREDDTILFCHRSFSEFLQDKNRSGPFYIDLSLDTVPNDIGKRVFDIINRNIDENYKIDPSVSWNINVATYHYMIRNVTAISVCHCNIDTLLRLITELTNKLSPLLVTSTWTYMHSLFFFRREIDDLFIGLKEVFDGTIYRLHKDKGESSATLKEFSRASSYLARIISRACRRASIALSSCTDFEVTPALVYLAEYSIFSATELPIRRLLTIAGVADGISALKQYHYIVPLSYIISAGRYRDSSKWIWDNSDTPSWPEVWGETTRHPLFQCVEEPDWRTHGAWRNLRIFFAKNSLEVVLDTENLCQLFHVFDGTEQFVTLARFFNSKTSDISDEEYFQNTFNITILKMMASLEPWTRVCENSSIDWEALYLIVSILCWFNRQLTNPKSNRLLHKYDETLEQDMTITMKSVFECAMKNIVEKHNDGGCNIFSARLPVQVRESMSLAVTIKVKPLPQGFDIENVDYPTPSWNPEIWLPFHQEAFVKTTSSTRTTTCPIIDPSHWHPYFVAQILKYLVEYLFIQINPGRLTYYRSYKKLFPHMIQCLPYAQPTLDNLNTLRTIVYFYPRVTPPWDPPEDFWRSLVEFIQRYNRSVLSSEELDLFVRWLDSTEHADIGTYV